MRKILLMAGLRSRLVVFIGLFFALATLGAGTASAAVAHLNSTGDTYSVYHGNDFGTVQRGYNAPAGTTQDWRVVNVCDMESDGHAVYVRYWLHDDRDGSNDLLTIYGNGAGGPCGTNNWASINVHITSFRVCEELPGDPDSCTAFYNTPRTAG